MTAFTIYLFGLADTAIVFFAIIFFVSAIAAILLGIGCMNEGGSVKKAHCDAFKFYLKISVIFGLLLALMPSKTTLLQMCIIPKIANNEIVKELPEDIHKWILKQIEPEVKQNE